MKVTIREEAIGRIRNIIKIEAAKGRDTRALEWAVEALCRMEDPV
jgi:hypothetical protein